MHYGEQQRYPYLDGGRPYNAAVGSELLSQGLHASNGFEKPSKEALLSTKIMSVLAQIDEKAKIK